MQPGWSRQDIQVSERISVRVVSKCQKNCGFDVGKHPVGDKIDEMDIYLKPPSAKCDGL